MPYFEITSDIVVTGALGAFRLGKRPRPSLGKRYSWLGWKTAVNRVRRNEPHTMWETNIWSFAFPSLSPFSDTQWRTSLRDLLTLLGNSEAGCRPCEGSLDGGVLSARARTCPWGCYWSDRAPARCCSSLQKEWLEEAFPVCLQMRSGTSGCDDKMQQNPADKPEA